MMRLLGMAMSGNCWKVATMLDLAGLPYAWEEVAAGPEGTRSAAFLARAPRGQVPVLVLDDGAVLTESGAILLHLAEGTRWLPPPGLPRTRVLEWLFFEQYSHEPYVAVARNLVAWKSEAHLHRARIATCLERGAAALDAMEARLAGADWLAGDAPTIADLALFAYTHRADEGGFALARWPAVASWIARVAALDGIRMLDRPPGWDAAAAR